MSNPRAVAPGQAWIDPVGKHRYVYLPGPYNNQSEAWAAARNSRGYPVVFNTMGEFQRVMQAFDYRTIAYAHTGHYQSPDGAEPGLGWKTYTNEPSAPLNLLFNSDGPDDGVRNKWGFNLNFSVSKGPNGTTAEAYPTIFYGPSKGKNEDAGVIWHDAGGLLEDVSVNGRGGVLVEFNSTRASSRLDKRASAALDATSPSRASSGINSENSDLLIGTDNDDILTGFGGADSLSGRGGDDVLWGGAGRDKLSGGSGQDAFIFGNQKSFNPATAVDEIVDFGPADKIALDATTFTALKDQPLSVKTVQSLTKAEASAALVTYDRSTGSLYYNQNGAAPGFGKGGQFAALPDGLNLTAANFIVQA